MNPLVTKQPLDLGLAGKDTSPCEINETLQGTPAIDTNAPRDLKDRSFSFLDAPDTPEDMGRIGPYPVRALIGEGGMGVVFRAHDPSLNRNIAIKVMHPEMLDLADNRSRFWREARAVATLRNENVVEIYFVGEHNGVPYLVMPLLEGESLEDRLRREPCLQEADLLRIGRETAEGLAAAHESGLVHRDIKPANIWLDGPKGKVKILDFGLAYHTHNELEKSSGGAKGTPHYMAPEQAYGEQVDGRADLFSLGCMLYRMSTGVLPFPGNNLFEVFRNLADHEPMSLKQRRPILPNAFCDLVMRLLRKNRDERPATAQEVVAVLKALEAGQSSLAETLLPSPVPNLPRPKGDRPPPFRHRVLLNALSIILAVGALIGGVVIIVRVIRPDGSRYEGELHWDSSNPGRPPTQLGVTSTQEKYAVELVTDQLSGWKCDFSPDGKFIALADELNNSGGTSGMWVHLLSTRRRLVTWEQRCESPGRMGNIGVEHAVFSHDGKRLYVGGRDFASPVAPNYLRLFDWDGEQITNERKVFDIKSGIAPLVLSPDDRLLALVGDKKVNVHDALTLKPEFSLEHLGYTTSLTFSPSGRFAATSSYDTLVRVWGLAGEEKGKMLKKLEGHVDRVHSVIWGGDEKTLFSGGDDGKVRRWNTERNEPEVVVTNPVGVNSLALSPNGKYLLVGDSLAGEQAEVFLRVWELASRKEVTKLRCGKQSVMTLIFTRNGGYFAAGSSARRVHVWKTPDWLLK